LNWSAAYCVAYDVRVTVLPVAVLVAVQVKGTSAGMVPMTPAMPAPVSTVIVPRTLPGATTLCASSALFQRPMTSALVM
jgi:hypothetical protein